MPDPYDGDVPPSPGGGAAQRRDEMQDVIEYDPETGTYLASRDSNEPISIAIISAVERISDTDSRNSTPLYAAVDPDALDDLVATGNGSGLRVTFTYNGYRIEVLGGDHFTVTVAEDGD